jgi:predicted lipoprotein
MKHSVPWLLVCMLTTSCEKAVPYEIVTPGDRPPPLTPAPSPDPGDHDGSQVDRDAGTQNGMDASATPETPAPKFSKRALLEAVASCSVAQYEDFAEHAEKLRVATRAWAKDVSEGKRMQAREAWRVANATWQRAELFRFGPAARLMDDPGGQDLRDMIYAFPQANPCLVDQRLVDETYAADFDALLIGARGLSSLEYLLFYGGTSNSCSAGISINTRGTWSALSESELTQRRADYAAAAAADVVTRTRTLVKAWSRDGEDFRTRLAKPGAGEVYASQQAALNAVSHGLFYLEKEIKDWKLGLPLGLTDGCAMTSCPNAVESLFAKVSKENIGQNLAAFRALFQGCGASNSGLGFDDWLRAVDADDLAERMLDALSGAELAVKELDIPVEEAVVSAPEKLQLVHAAVKKLNDLLKTEFVSTLNLELPMGAEGDND